MRFPVEQLLAQVDERDFSDRRDVVGTGAFEHTDVVDIDELAEHDIAHLHSLSGTAFHDVAFLTREEIACFEAMTPIAPKDFVKAERRSETALQVAPQRRVEASAFALEIQMRRDALANGGVHRRSVVGVWRPAMKEPRHEERDVGGPGIE